MARTSNIANIATSSRASKAWAPGGWDFVSGSAVGALVEYAANVTRDTVDGILVEESTTNLVPNARLEGAVVGTPGTSPTDVAITAGGTTTSIVATGTEDGWPYVDIRFNGTPTSDPSVALTALTGIAVSASTAYCVSVGLKIVAGDMTNITAIGVGGFQYSSVPAYLANFTFTAETPDTQHRRYFSTATTHASAAYLRPIVLVDWDGAGAIDITLRIYSPQCEQKAYPTSPVLPTALSPAASTRAEDMTYITIPAGFFNSNEGTFYVECSAGAKSDSDRSVPWALHLSGSLRLYPYITATPTWRLWSYDGADRLGELTDVITAGVQTHKVAVYLSDANCKWTVKNDDISFSDYVVAPPVSLQLANYIKLIIGGASSTRQLNGYIKDFRYWPEELSDAQMAALVGN